VETVIRCGTREDFMDNFTIFTDLGANLLWNPFRKLKMSQ
jgi:hypothetical protein